MKLHIQSRPLSAEVEIPVGSLHLEANLNLPAHFHGVVVFVHGSGSSRFSPRNRFVAEGLRQHHIGTLLLDLLTAPEDDDYRKRFDIDLLATRVESVLEWLMGQPETGSAPVGLFGASTGAAAALKAAALSDKVIRTVVSRGGRPDLAGQSLKLVRCPTLLIVGRNDTEVLKLNEEALASLQCEKHLVVVPHATHLFEEPGALEGVTRLASDWFAHYL